VEKMDYKIKKILTNWRVILVFIVLLLAIVAIYPNFSVEGVAIRNVMINSSASVAGIESSKSTAAPMSREKIISINNVMIKNISDYYDTINSFIPNTTVQIKTNKNLYQLLIRPKINITVLNETEDKIITETIQVNETINGTLILTNKTVDRTILVNKTIETLIGSEDIGLVVYPAPKTNLRKGLDLQGGTRVLLKPEQKLDQENMDILIENMKYRLNVYGLSDIVVRESNDLSGNQYILVEIAGANEEEVKDLMAKQGKFEAKIGNETVFKGGGDITHVCRTADCSGIDPSRGCGMSGDFWVCRFMFSISLTPEAAQRQADLTKDLDVITDQNKEEYLSEKLYLYLDDVVVDELNIGTDLKGRAVTDIAISGSGSGGTEQAALYNTLDNMKKLQTVLITGSLPVKLSIIKTDNISPMLGEEFVKSAIMMGLLSLAAVLIILIIRYRKLKLVIPMIMTSLIETVVLMGVAAIIGWNLDLAAIAGIIISVGTGINDQIVISDEALRGGGSSSENYDWKKKIKNAFFIVMGAYFTMGVAMIPLMSAGAGLLKGFAITTLIGITIGVFITRPAYAHVIEILLKD
jgi:preprotein translocase subunit SecD